MPRRRLGVALLLSPPCAAEVDGIRRAVGDGSLDRIPPHVTLVPPVNVREERIPEALALLRAAAAATRPFDLELGPPATFLPENPVLYLAVSGQADALTALRDAVFREPFERSLSWPFVPHVTLADDSPPERIGDALRALRDYRVRVRFDRVHLLEETRADTGERRWVPIADVPFEPRRVVGRGGLELELTVSDDFDVEARDFDEAAWARNEEVRYPGQVERPFAVAARRDGVVVGTAGGHTLGDHCYLARLIVDDGLRKEGIGSRILAAVESLAAERGCNHLQLRTQAGGDAQRFYERHGWYVTGELPSYRRNRDFVVMRRDV